MEKFTNQFTGNVHSSDADPPLPITSKCSPLCIALGMSNMARSISSFIVDFNRSFIYFSMNLEQPLKIAHKYISSSINKVFSHA